MPLKRLRNTGDVTNDQSKGTDEDVSAISGPTRRKVAKAGLHGAEPTRSSGYSAELQPPSASQRQEQYGRDLRKYPSVNQTVKKAAATQPEGLQSQYSQQKGSAMQSDTGAQSENEEDFEEREDDRANDPACIECDDGGTIMFCDGSCMRAVHCGVEKLQHDCTSDSDMQSHEPAPPDSPTKLQPFPCNPLDMPLDLYQHLKDTKDTFHCPNCLAGVHQCFKCKLEGVVEAHAADPHNTRFANQLVYRCGVAACGRFYHAACIDKTEEDMQAAFLCPLHTCKACGGNDSDSIRGELIPCRRCPKAFHEHCMPRSLLNILGKDRKQRIWVAQFENGECISEVERSLIYCKAHKIPDDCNNPEHERPVFRKALLQRWKVHFAHLFPNLASSQKMLAQVELTKNVPFSNRLREMSRRTPGSSSQTPSRSATSSPTASDPTLPCGHGLSQQPSFGQDVAAALPAAQGHDSNLSKTAQNAGNLATARQGPPKRTSAEVTRKAAPVPYALHKAVPQTEMTPAELKALARRLKAAKQAGQAPQASASDRAVPSVSGPSAAASSGKAGTSSMGPPAARGKRPPLSDRSLFPPKKRRATEAALPLAQGRPAAAAQVPQGDSPASKPASAVLETKVGGMPPPPLRRLVRAGSSSSTDSQQPKAGSSQVLVPELLASASLVQAAKPAAADQAAGTAAAAAAVPATAAVQLLKPQSQFQSQTQTQSGGKAIPMPSDLSAQYIGEYQEEPDEEDVDIQGDSHAVPPTLDAQEPAADEEAVPHAGVAGAAGNREAGVPAAAITEAAPKAGIAEAAGNDATEAEIPTHDVTHTPAGAGSAPAQDAAQPLPTGRWKLTTEYARRLQAMSDSQRQAQAKQCVKQIILACKKEGRVTLDKVIQNTRQPEPYRLPSKRTVDEERLRLIERAVAAAEMDRSKAGRWLDAKIAREMLMHEDNLAMVLAPFLHGNRYSSYGRHFTKLVLLRQVAQMLTFYLHDGDTVVDFSCGANAFVPLVKQEGAKQGLSISGRSYDIITSQNLEDFERCSWMDVQPGDLPAGDNLVIGLNPPFGKNNGLAKTFVQQAAKFCPRVIVLIVPPEVPIPRGYQVMYEEQDTMKDRAFFVPGSKNDSWNNVPPALRVLLRHEWVNRNPPDGTGWYHSSIAPMYGSHCCPRPAPVQPHMPHHPLPQQQVPWQQAPSHYPPVQQRQQQQGFQQYMPAPQTQHAQQAQQVHHAQQAKQIHHAQQAQRAQQVQHAQQAQQQHHAQQQHMFAQQAQQQALGLQGAPLPLLPPLAPGQPQHSLTMPVQHHVRPPPLPRQNSGRPAWLSMPMPASLPGPYHQ